MEKEKITNIYENVSKGLVYEGGPNFLNGRRECTDCESEMHRTPLNQSFVRVQGGKILVNVNSNSGEMMLSKADPKWHWSCNNCTTAISPHQ